MRGKGYLFIGGPADGEWRAIPDARGKVLVPVVSSPMSPFPFGVDFEEAEYRRESFYIRDADPIEMFVFADMSLADAVIRLLSNYRPGEGEPR